MRENFPEYSRGKSYFMAFNIARKMLLEPDVKMVILCPHLKQQVEKILAELKEKTDGETNSV